MLIEDPYTAPEITRSLVEVERDVAEFFRSLTAEEFVVREGDAWNPAEHLQHLCIAVSAVARGFTMSRWLLRLRFGRSRAPSRRYLELSALYRDLLGKGARARGGFVPERIDPAGAEIEARRGSGLARWQRVNLRLRDGMARWSERQLERIHLPHPLLGKLTAREMLFFTLYHNQHHVAAAKRRLPRFVTTLALLGCLLIPIRLTAQDTTRLAPSARLRVTVTAPAPRTQIGTYRALTDSTLVLGSGAVPVIIPLANIDRLELSRGRRLNVAAGIAGLVIGAAAGAALGCAANRDSYGVFCGGQSDTKVIAGAVLGGAVGATVGAVLFRREQWQSLDLAELNRGRRRGDGGL